MMILPPVTVKIIDPQIIAENENNVRRLRLDRLNRAPRRWQGNQKRQDAKSFVIFFGYD